MDEWGKLGQNSKIDNIKYLERERERERERDAIIKTSL